MKAIKWAVLTSVVVLGGIQFIRPEKNLRAGTPADGIGRHFVVPTTVDSVLRRSCYDCHSDHTNYPWYAEIQPVGWWLSSHIRDGKRGLNFDEYAGYRLAKQYHRFKDIIDQVQTEKMPLPSYLFIHTYARLKPEEKNALIQWCAAMRDSMKTKFPVDSLERRPQREDQTPLTRR